MTADTAVLERALTVMAICMALQTLMFIGAAIGALIAWRRTAEAVGAAKIAADAQIADLREKLERVSATVEEAAQALIHSASVVDDVVMDARTAVGRVGSSVGSVASVMSGPRAALALGLWRGIQTWRKRRAANGMNAAVTSEL
jgi:hypothetical protein